MTSTNPWDSFEAAGNFVSFEAVGDSFSGTILSIGAKTWPAENGKAARTTPQLAMLDDDGEEWTLTAGWALLISELKKQAPNVGDHLAITCTGIAAKPKETKSWSLVVKKAGTFTPTVPAPAAGAAPAPTAAPPAPAPAPAADALAGVTPEQLAAMQALAAPAAAWDSDPRVAQLRGMGIADEAIRSTLNI